MPEIHYIHATTTVIFMLVHPHIVVLKSLHAPLQNLLNVHYLRGIIQIACYSLFSTVPNEIFYKKKKMFPYSPQDKKYFVSRRKNVLKE